MRKMMAATLAFLPVAASAAQPASQPRVQVQRVPQAEVPAAPACERFGRVEQAQGRAVLQAPPAAARRLDQLPAGDVHLTVDRRMDGCHIPVIIRQNVGARPIIQR